MNSFNSYYFITYSMQCKKIEMNILKIKICLTITKKKSDEKYIYLLFARFKKTYVPNELKRPREVVDDSV